MLLFYRSKAISRNIDALSLQYFLKLLSVKTCTALVILNERTNGSCTHIAESILKNSGVGLCKCVMYGSISLGNIDSLSRVNNCLSHFSPNNGHMTEDM